MKKLIISTTLLVLSSISCAANSADDSSSEPDTIAKADALYIALDNSGSMQNKFNWISESLAQLNNQLAQQANKPHQLQLYGFSNQTQLLADGDVDSILKGIKNIDEGDSKEDGLIPINHIATQKNTQNAHVILFTDETRTPMKDINYNDLLNQLKDQNMTVHVVVSSLSIELDQQIVDEQGVNIALKDQQSYLSTINQLTNLQLTAHYDKKYDQYCQQKKNGKKPTLCKNEASKRYWSTFYNEEDSYYINLAFATGGTVWDIKKIQSNQTYFADFMSKTITGRDNEITYSPKVLVLGDTLSGKIEANQLLTFEASENLNLVNNRHIEQWLWDFDGDGNMDDQGPTVMYQFDQPGLHKVHLWTYRNSTAGSLQSKRIVQVLVE